MSYIVYSSVLLLNQAFSLILTFHLFRNTEKIILHHGYSDLTTSESAHFKPINEDSRPFNLDFNIEINKALF